MKWIKRIIGLFVWWSVLALPIGAIGFYGKEMGNWVLWGYGFVLFFVVLLCVFYTTIAILGVMIDWIAGN